MLDLFGFTHPPAGINDINIMNVAIISGSKFFREAVRFILTDKIRCVFVSESPAFLLDQAYEGRYDLILIDGDSVNLKDGEVVSKLEKLKRSKTKIVLFSFNLEEKLKELNRAVRIDLFIHRPLNPSVIKDILPYLKTG